MGTTQQQTTARQVMLTGAGSGIGKATCSLLLKKGYRVFGGAISEAEAQSLQQHFGPDFTPLLMDVRDEASVASAAQQVAEQLGNRRLTALLNIAGVIANGPLADLPAAEFSNLLAVNLVGMHITTRAFLPLLGSDAQRTGAPGRIINMSSASGTRTMPFSGAYSASKFGVEALSAAMRMEFVPFGIAVAVIAPGLINTPMAARILEDLQRPSSLPVYRDPLHKFLVSTLAAAQQGLPLENVVQLIVRAVETPRPRARYEIHHSYWRDAVLMRLLPIRLREYLVTRILGLQQRVPQSQHPSP